MHIQKLKMKVSFNSNVTVQEVISCIQDTYMTKGILKSNNVTLTGAQLLTSIGTHGNLQFCNGELKSRRPHQYISGENLNNYLC